ncbi:glycoside hydrolase [Aspergillus germanicus]
MSKTTRTEADAEALVQRLTLNEKVALTAAVDWWRTAEVNREGLHLPHIKTSDGPNGARGERFVSGVKAACFPCSSSVGASFDTSIAHEVGRQIALETRSKNADVILAPTVNVIRGPLGELTIYPCGRNHETYSEDPHVLGMMGAAYINGCQSARIEKRRQFLTAEADEQALRELYLYPFQLILKHSDPWCFMTSYNRVNGTYTSDSPYLIQGILRNEWGFRGLVMSDWVGTYSTAAAINAGLDLEMPGPTIFRGDLLLNAVKDGRVSEETVTRSAKRVIELVQNRDVSVDAERDEFIATSAAESTVLLRNEGNILPLQPGAKAAIIGQHATVPAVGGGGSAKVHAEHVVTPWDALQKSDLQVTYEPGVPVYGSTPFPVPGILSPTGRDGSPASVARPNKVKEETRDTTEYMIKEKWPTYLDQNYCNRLTFDITPKATGNRTFAIFTTGTVTLKINGKQAFHRSQEPVLQREAFYFFRTQLERHYTHPMQAGHKYTVTLESWAADPKVVRNSVGGEVVQGSGVGFVEEVNIPKQIRSAAETASNSDVAIVFVGTAAEFESEGYDRETMDLTPNQYELVHAVLAANPKSVVVNYSGSPVTMFAFDNVPALVQAWFPGQECGTAIARVLTGHTNPSGCLPFTWPRRLEDNPTFENWPTNDNDEIFYKEGLFVGYRYYDQPGSPKPLFPFGHGLSYTSFELSELRFEELTTLNAEISLQVTCNVKNTGTRDGKVVVQFYICRLGGSSSSSSKGARVEKQLKGFTKTFIKAGQSVQTGVSLDKYAVSYYDTRSSCWRAEKGEHEVLAGFSAENIVARASFSLGKGFCWIGL